VTSYKELEVWQKSIDLTTEIYEATKSFPSEEKFGLTAQIRRCSVSVPSNIAEGWGRNSTKEYIRFLYISRGSITELETQLIIARNLNYIGKNQYDTLAQQLQSIHMMINKLISRLATKLK
jgi:four helix bundle protein